MFRLPVWSWVSILKWFTDVRRLYCAFGWWRLCIWIAFLAPWQRNVKWNLCFASGFDWFEGFSNPISVFELSTSQNNKCSWLISHARITSLFWRCCYLHPLRFQFGFPIEPNRMMDFYRAWTRTMWSGMQFGSKNENWYEITDRIAFDCNWNWSRNEELCSGGWPKSRASAITSSNHL